MSDDAPAEARDTGPHEPTPPPATSAAETPDVPAERPAGPPPPAPYPPGTPPSHAPHAPATPPPPYAQRPQGSPAAPYGGTRPYGPATAYAPTPPPPAPSRPPSRASRAVADFWRAGDALSPTTLVLAAAVGVAGAVVLVGHRVGLGAAVVGLAVWAAAVPALVRRRAVGDLLTATLSVALVAMVAVRDAGWILAVCLVAAAALGAVAATGARSTPAVLTSLVGWGAGLLRALPWVWRAARAGTRRGNVAAVARTALVTTVLLVAFGLLFSSADLVFASYLPDLRLDRLPAQIIVGLAVALVAATLAHLAAAPPGWADLHAKPGRPVRLAEWATPVLALDAMVLAFVLVQVGGLLGGHRHVLAAANLSYAEYARQGFGQLVAATALTLLVVGIAARHAPRTTPGERRAVGVALGVLCVATLGVVGSALRRMDLYVEAFGLTRLRLFVVVAEVALGAVLLLVLAAGVRWRGAWLPRAVAQVAGVAVLGLALANPDAIILRHNTTVLAQATQGDGAGEIGGQVGDLGYLRGLSADAVPAAAQLDEPLRACVLTGIDVTGPSGPIDWNLGRARAVAALDDLPVLACRLAPDDR